jgi:hypothetical protein
MVRYFGFGMFRRNAAERQHEMAIPPQKLQFLN